MQLNSKHRGTLGLKSQQTGTWDDFYMLQKLRVPDFFRFEALILSSLSQTGTKGILYLFVKLNFSSFQSIALKKLIAVPKEGIINCL
jgi:hypothetical protein